MAHRELDLNTSNNHSVRLSSCIKGYLLTYLLTYLHHTITNSIVLASCLTNAQPLSAHSPATDDNSLIGCTSHDLTDAWSLASTHFVDSQYTNFRALLGAFFYRTRFIWPQRTVRQYHSYLSDQSALGIRVRLRLKLHYFSIFHGE